MSTVEQIHHLESRVDRLLAVLRESRSDNDSLRGELAATEERAADLDRRLAESETARQEADRRGDDLQQRLSALQAEQEEIEATINRTLAQLGNLEIGTSGEPDADAGAEAESATGAEQAEDDADDAEPAPMDDEAPPAPDESGTDDAGGDANRREGDDLDIF
jgi:chromosome segregation ATPase